MGLGRGAATARERGASRRWGMIRVMFRLTTDLLSESLIQIMESSALPLPLPQSPEYARTCAALGLGIQCGVRDGLHWQIQTRRLPVFGRVGLLSRGPVARDPGTLAEWFAKDLRDREHGPLILNADGPDAAQMRAAGFWPLVTPATIALLPLGPETEMRAAMHPKWRSQLNRAMRKDLRVTRHPLSPDHWLLEAEARQARARRYRSLPPALFAVFSQVNPGKALIWEAWHDGQPAAAIAVLCHGRMATWQTGVTLAEGRKRDAMALLLWEAMRWLAGRGHELLDLGILNGEDAPGLTRFKLRTGARAHRLGGTWLHLPVLAPVARRLPACLAA